MKRESLSLSSRFAALRRKPKTELLASALAAVPALATRLIGQVLSRGSLVCLTYHSINTPGLFDDEVVSCSLEELDWQAAFLARTVRVLDGSEVVRFARGQLELDEPAVCVTFDDGYADNLRAGEVLRRHGLPAIFFLTTGIVGTTAITDWDRLAHAVKMTKNRTLAIPAVGRLGPWTIEFRENSRETIRALQRVYRSIPGTAVEAFVSAVERAAGANAVEFLGGKTMFLSWDEVRALARMGHTIGAHTHSHRILSTLTDAEQVHEVAHSKAVIETHLSTKVNVFAYPVGKPFAFSERTKQIVRDCGFEVAFSFYGGRNLRGALDRFDIRRIAVERDTSRELFRARTAFSFLFPVT
jgi:peptidoglycan/xylan/chitin deacetylase (PgdA/CDA1 family)